MQSYTSDAHAYSSYAHIYILMLISPHDSPPCPRGTLWGKNGFFFFFLIKVPYLVISLPMPCHHLGFIICHLLWASFIILIFCTCNSPRFHICFPFLLVTCLFWGGIFGMWIFFLIFPLGNNSGVMASPPHHVFHHIGFYFLYYEMFY